MRWYGATLYTAPRPDSPGAERDELGNYRYNLQAAGEYPARLSAWTVKDFERYGARALIDAQKISIRGNPPPFVSSVRIDGVAYEAQEIERNQRYAVYMGKTVKGVYGGPV